MPINDNALYAVPWSYWYNGDDRGIEPPAETKRQLGLYDEALATADPAKQAELFKQVIEIAKNEFRSFGISLLTGTYARRHRPDGQRAGDHDRLGDLPDAGAAQPLHLVRQAIA